MEKALNDATVPSCSDHPVDVLKWCAEQAGLELDPEAEAQFRAICDKPDDMSEYIARKLEMNKPSILPSHIHNTWEGHS